MPLPAKHRLGGGVFWAVDGGHRPHKTRQEKASQKTGKQPTYSGSARDADPKPQHRQTLLWPEAPPA